MKNIGDEKKKLNMFTLLLSSVVVCAVASGAGPCCTQEKRDLPTLLRLEKRRDQHCRPHLKEESPEYVYVTCAAGGP